MPDPRLSVMYRYVEEYTNAHNLDVAREIMHPDYRFTMSGSTLDLPSYLAMVEGALDHFTDLSLVVDRFIVGPDRLAMAFREMARSARHDRSATWHGVALYEFHDDGRLAGVAVEQDFWGRRRQFAGTSVVEPVGETDPAVWETATGTDEPMTRAAIESALQTMAVAAGVTYDDGSTPIVRIRQVSVNDLVVAGDGFAAWLTLAGPYAPDPAGPVLTLDPGTPLTISATGTGTLEPDGSISAHFVTDRYGVWILHRTDP